MPSPCESPTSDVVFGAVLRLEKDRSARSSIGVSSRRTYVRAVRIGRASAEGALARAPTADEPRRRQAPTKTIRQDVRGYARAAVVDFLDDGVRRGVLVVKIPGNRISPAVATQRGRKRHQGGNSQSGKPARRKPPVRKSVQAAT